MLRPLDEVEVSFRRAFRTSRSDRTGGLSRQRATRLPLPAAQLLMLVPVLMLVLMLVLVLVLMPLVLLLLKWMRPERYRNQATRKNDHVRPLGSSSR